MAETRTGAELLVDIQRLKGGYFNAENSMILDARCEILDGGIKGRTTDLAKFSVALWGFDAEEYMRVLQKGTKKLTDVAGEPVLFGNLRGHDVGIIHPEYVDDATKSSWELELVTFADDEYRSKHASIGIMPHIVGKLLVKTQMEMREGFEGDDSRYVSVWSAKGYPAGDKPAPREPELFVGTRAMIASTVLSDERHLISAFERVLDRVRQ